MSVDAFRPATLIYKSSHLLGLIHLGMSLFLYAATAQFRSTRSYLKLDFDGIELSSPMLVRRFPWSDIARFERCRIQRIEVIRIRFRHPEAKDRVITNLYRATLDESVVELER